MTRFLVGKRVLVTRPEDQAVEFASRVAELGAIPVLLPAIQIEPIEDASLLDSALLNLNRFDWVVFTSVNGVAAVKRRMEALGIRAEALASRQLAVIGPATADALRAFCRAPDLIPEEFVSEGIGDALREVKGKSFLLARADLARKELADDLRARGAKVTEVDAYRIRPLTGDLDSQKRPDIIALTSSAGAAATLDRFERAGCEQWLRTAAIVCIGPITAETVRAKGYPVAKTAEVYTSDGLIEALRELGETEATRA